MLTSKDFRDIRLGRVRFGGYKAEDVNAFVEEARDSIIELEKENLKLLNKVKELAAKNSKFNDERESIRTALVKAQVLADSSVDEAKIKADEIINIAKKDSERILDEAKKEAEKYINNFNNEVNMQKEQLSSLKKAVKDFRSNILNIYKDHIKLVNSLTADERLPEETNKNSVHDNHDNKGLVSHEDENKEKIKDKPLEKVENEENKVTNKKFADLKFGEDYDISKDIQESSVGLFKKI